MQSLIHPLSTTQRRPWIKGRIHIWTFLCIRNWSFIITILFWIFLSKTVSYINWTDCVLGSTSTTDTELHHPITPLNWTDCLLGSTVTESNDPTTLSNVKKRLFNSNYLKCIFFMILLAYAFSYLIRFLLCSGPNCSLRSLLLCIQNWLVVIRIYLDFTSPKIFHILIGLTSY